MPTTTATRAGAGDLRPEAYPTHPSLHRIVLMAGVEPRVIVIEVTAAFALVFGVGFHLATVGLAVFYLTVVHGLMAWVAKQDPQMTSLYLRSLSTRDYYTPQARIRAAAPQPMTSVPSGRPE